MAKQDKKNTNPNGACIEKGVWTALPNAVPSTTNFIFTPPGAGAMTFHMVGCSGDPDLTGPGSAVAGGMASQISGPANPAVAPSFLYHLGDIAYTESGSAMTGPLWNTQFYAQYAAYKDCNGPLPVFSIAGNFKWNAMLSSVARLFVYGSVAAALPVLRRKQPEVDSFRLPFGITIAVLALIFTGVMVTRMHWGDLIVISITAGLAFVNWLWARKRTDSSETTS